MATNMRDARCLKVYVELQFCIQLYQWGDAIDVWEERRTEKVGKPCSWSKSLVTFNFTFISSFKIKMLSNWLEKNTVQNHIYSYCQKKKRKCSSVWPNQQKCRRARKISNSNTAATVTGSYHNFPWTWRFFFLFEWICIILFPRDRKELW